MSFISSAKRGGAAATCQNFFWALPRPVRDTRTRYTCSVPHVYPTSNSSLHTSISLTQFSRALINSYHSTLPIFLPQHTNLPPPQHHSSIRTLSRCQSLYSPHYSTHLPFSFYTPSHSRSIVNTKEKTSFTFL